MSTQYTINLVNKMSAKQTFWCFLDKPVELANKAVFANSSAFLTIAADDTSNINQFIVPLQYVVGAGASNHAVGLNTKIVSNANRLTETGKTWNATYNLPNQGPDLADAGLPSHPPSSISIVNNSFNPTINAPAGWYESQSFGILSSAGFIGVTWEPQPSETIVISPKFSLYLAIGNFATSTLADFDEFSNKAAEITLDDFSSANQVWVTREADGTWTKAKTGTSPMQAMTA